MERFAIDSKAPRMVAHVFYGGAHLFKPGLFAKLGERALGSPEAALVSEKVKEKLRREPVEDFRIDFEDGFGWRSEEEEDQAATQAGIEFARMSLAGGLPRRIGIRPKADYRRAWRTLETFLKYATGAPLPKQLIVTQPKIEKVEEAKCWREMLEKAEVKFRLPGMTLRHEILVEHPSAVRNLAEIARTCENRLDAGHFGCYDYLSSMQVPAPAQSLDHPYATLARWTMQQVLTPLGVAVSDGVYTKLPTGEDAAARRDAFEGHRKAVARALNEGMYCGWDVHPGQLLSRYAALYEFFEAHRDDVLRRYKSFQEAQTKATRAGTQFDDAATVEGLMVFLRRGSSCGAFTEEEIA
ncbi:MAG: malate synthase [Acidobacteria bacterium]|nr:malate synthase [Acidobacteriota bacterium]